MDRSLWLLLRLRASAWLRRWGRSVRSLKGALLAVVGSLFFAPMMISFILAPRIHTEAQSELIRRYGALGLLVFCVLNVVMSSGERAVYYSPAEVNFLFCGPYPPRQLLLYKIAAGLGAALTTAPFMTLAFAHHAHGFAPAFVGLLLALQFMAMFTIAVSLAISTVGAHAFTRGRQVLLLAIATLVLAILMPAANEAANTPPIELLERARNSPVLSVTLLPFQPFVRAFTAERLWPDLALWSAAAAGVDVVLVLIILALNAHFLEASAAASSRLYARIKSARRGEAWSSGPPRVLFRLPMLPWWGGLGPNLWRQLTTASRQLSKIVGLGALFLVPVTVVLMILHGLQDEPNTAAPAMSMILSIAVFAPTMIGFDFRSDLGRMEDLKTLPIPTNRLVLGQLATPVVLLTAIEWLSVTVIAIPTRPNPALYWGIVAMTPAVNLLFLAIDNLYFLWFPFRMMAINTVDFQAMGRQILLVSAKFATVGAAATLASGVGALAFFATGQSWAAAITAAWLVLVACGLALIPLVALAFNQFDVAQNLPD